jgi:hypothetical protein
MFASQIAQAIREVAVAAAKDEVARAAGRMPSSSIFGPERQLESQIAQLLQEIESRIQKTARK